MSFGRFAVGRKDEAPFLFLTLELQVKFRVDRLETPSFFNNIACRSDIRTISSEIPKDKKQVFLSAMA